MIRIIVVDDDAEMHTKVRKIITKLSFKVDTELSVSCYTKLDNKLEEMILDDSCHKIYILDIELANNGSGIQIAKKIREHDWDSQIIFMTNHDKMFETVYRSVYEVFTFIEKFHNFDERLETNIKKILDQKFDNKMFCYSGRNVDLQLYLKSILYIYRDTTERKVVLVTDNIIFSVGLSMHEIMNYLDGRFKMVHRACIVNMDHVQVFNWSNRTFLLDNGQIIPLLSRKYRKEVEGK